MSDDALIEKMARAMCELFDTPDGPLPESDWRSFIDQAEASLAICKPVIEQLERERCIVKASKVSAQCLPRCTSYDDGFVDGCDEVVAALKEDGDE